MTLLNKIQSLMKSDDCNRSTQSARLKNLYETTEHKDVLDAAFICLCGYSLETLTKRK